MSYTTTEQALIDAVRLELGKIPVENVVDILDADIIAENGRVLKLIADKITKKVLRSLTTIAYTDVYPVNDNTLRVAEVYPSNVLSATSDGFNDPAMTGIIVNTGSDDPENAYEFPSLATIDALRRRRGTQRLRFEYDPIARTVRIIPMPVVVNVPVWYLSVEKSSWTLATVPEDFQVMMLDGTVWRCLEVVMLRRSQEGGIQRSGGQIDYPADRMKPFIDGRKSEFEKALDGKAMLYSI